MRELIIHIGWPKTGSSSLQSLFANNQDRLRSVGFLYPTAERWEDAHHRFCDLLILHHDPLIPPPNGDLDAFLSHLDLPENRDASRIVLSSEGLCRAISLKPGAVRRLRECFRVRILACLREPVFWANSLLNEFAKSRLMHQDTIDLDALGRQMIERDIHYPARLRLWSDAFGREAVDVVTINESDDYLSRALAALDLDREYLVTNTDDGRNQSLRIGCLQLIGWLVRSGRLPHHARRVALDTRLRSVPFGPSPNLLAPAVEQMIKAVTPSISEALSRDWLGGRSAFANERVLQPHKSADALDSPDLHAIARHVFADDDKLLAAFARDLAPKFDSKTAK